MQEPSDPGEVHHSEANQDQQGERAPPGVSAREDGVFGAGAVESVRKAELRAGTQGGKKYNPKVFCFFYPHFFLSACLSAPYDVCYNFSTKLLNFLAIS